MPDRIRSISAPFALLVALLACRPASAAGVGYGDIEVSTETEPRGYFIHGYTEYRFQVKNLSVDRAHAVTLQIPGETGSRRRGGKEGSLTSITKSIEVAAG